MKSNKAVLVSLFYLVISAAWAADPSSYASGTIGFTWEQREGPAALRVALPRVEASVGYGTPLWGWACFQVSEEGAQQAKVVIDVERNYWLKFPQEVDAISYGSLAVGLMPEARLFPHPPPVCPYPGEYPPEVRDYLGPGNLIESDAFEMVAKAQELIEVGGANPQDMLEVAYAILQSEYMRKRPYDYENLRGVQNGTVTPSFNDVYVDSALIALRRGIGVCASNSRLGVALLRSVGIPAHTVSRIGLHVWLEFWINGLGWFPAEVTGGSTQWPKRLEPNTGLLDIASGKNDTCVWILWQPAELCYFRLLKENEYWRPEFTESAKLVVVLPGEPDAPGPMLEGRCLRLPGGNYGYFFSHENDYYFRLYDRNGHILSEVKLELDTFQAFQIGPENYWRLRPHEDHNWLILESLFFVPTLGDINLDGVVDREVYYILAVCMAGPDDPNPPPGCDPIDFHNADFYGDNDVDLADFGLFQTVFTGQ